jgi:predicted FMN-binding regulatory protein PaiB
MRGIVGFSLTVTKIDAVKKISQNRDHQSKQNIIVELAKLDNHGANEISRLMEEEQQ